jgi:hypothetical protein
MFAVKGDEEFSKLLKDVQFPWSGVVPSLLKNRQEEAKALAPYVLANDSEINF